MKPSPSQGAFCNPVHLLPDNANVVLRYVNEHRSYECSLDNSLLYDTVPVVTGIFCETCPPFASEAGGEVLRSSIAVPIWIVSRGSIPFLAVGLVRAYVKFYYCGQCCTTL